mmetsp:Transcript_72920/g.170829  ORF Transcript_72920/g.170829 Transcript_72920/m.170829 type:complete len:401 (-) Transcript_72920:80-1282(-)
MGGQLCSRSMVCAVLAFHRDAEAQVGACSVQAPLHGDLGNCPEALSSGSSCVPACNDGYDLDGLATCAMGQLNMPSCLPSSCNVSEALDWLEEALGACPEILESGESCEPECADGLEPSDNVTCHLGNLTEFTCLPAGKLHCQAGYQASLDFPARCEPCPIGTYKVGGSGPCTTCPPGSRTNRTGRISAVECMCHDTYYELRDASLELLSCVACPNNSEVVGVNRHRFEDCKCQEGFVREPSSEAERLQYCRPAEPCNVSGFLSNLTGPETYKLKMGSCEAKTNSSFLPSGTVCSLACNAGFGAQLGSDVFRAVDLALSCEDGTLVRKPPEGYLWCSEASWELPPLVFLGITTAATVLGGAAIEVRQHRLERRYAQALKLRPVPRPKRASSNVSEATVSF